MTNSNPCSKCINRNIKVEGLIRKSDILIVGESPGEEEVKYKIPFIGKSGQLLNTVLTNIMEINRNEVAITNAVKCMIQKEDKKVSSFVRETLQSCRTFLVEDIQKVQPRIIVCLGEIATLQIFGKKYPISRVRGRILKSEEFNCEVYCMFHPSYILRTGGISENNSIWKLWAKDWLYLKEYLNNGAIVKEKNYDVFTTTDGMRAGKIFSLDCEWDENENLIAIGIGGKNFARTAIISEMTPRDRESLVTLFNRRVFVVANRPVDEYILLKNGFPPPKNVIDLFNIANLVDDNMKISLENIANIYTEERNIKDINRGKKVWELSREDLIKYNCQDCEVTMKAFSVLMRKLKRDEILFRYWRFFTQPISDMLADIGIRGIKINTEKLIENKQFLQKEKIKLEQSLISRLPIALQIKYKDNLNLTRNNIIIDYLFNSEVGLRLEPEDYTPTGLPSLAEEHLNQYNNEWISDYIKWKKISKLISTYLEGIEKFVKDGKIHPNTVLYRTSTGRTAMMKPNLQNIPQRGMPYVDKCKEIFEAPEGFLIGARDLAQSELRIIAWLAQEKNMLKAFREGLDLHRMTASIINNIPPEAVTKEMRQTAKAVNFGFIYGCSPSTFRGVAKNDYGIEFSLAEAEQIRSKFFDIYPALVRYHDKCKRIVRQFKQIRSPLGRVRRLPNIDSDDPYHRAEAERQAINFPVQSFSSDLALIGMYLFWKEVKNVKSIYPFLFIHDSVMFLARENVIDKAMKLLKECMEERAVEYIKKHFKIKIGYPVKSEGKYGRSWADLKDYEEV
jgi:uracil-DNA glycosylase family 4